MNMRSSPSRKPQNQNKKSCFIFLLLAAGSIFILLTAVFLFLLLGKPTPKAATVAFGFPKNGSAIEIGQPVPITASANQEKGISRLEIYADGGLVKSQIAETTPPGSQLTAAFLWTPLTSGRHLLTARAYPVQGNAVDTSIVFVDILPKTDASIAVDNIPRSPGSSLPSLREISNVTGIPLDELLGANPSLAGYSPELPLPLGTSLHVPTPPSPGVTTPPAGITPPVPGTSPGSGPGASPGSGPGPIPGAPIAPTWLTVDPSACSSIHLAWTDSPDESGYLVYRRAPGEANLNLVSRLPANSTSLNDPTASTGTYYYQVAAARGTLESRSAIYGVVLPAHCAPAAPPPPSTVVDVSLSILKLETASTYDGIYCYYAVDGGLVDRLPAREPAALSPNPGGHSYPVTTRLPNRGRFLLGGHPASSPVTLMLKCRGYEGALSVDIGKVELSEPRANWDGSERTATSSVSPGFNIKYCIKVGSTPCGVDPETPVFLVLPPLELLFNLPAPNNLRVANTLDACDEVASYDIPNHLGEYLGCIISGIFGVGQETVYWDWSGAGSIYTEASLRGYLVTARITDLASGTTEEYFLRDVHPSSRKFTLASIPPACGKRISFSVQAVAGGRLSVPSEELIYESPACPSAVRLRITFDQLTLGPIDDEGDSWIFPPPRDIYLELTNSMIVSGGSLSASLVKVSRPTSKSFSEGTYNLANEDFLNVSGLPIYYGINNNYFDVPITADNQDVTFVFGASDTDDHWFGAAENTYDDTCYFSTIIPARSLQNWLMYSQDFRLEGAGTSETYCQVLVHARTFAVP